MKLHSDLLPQLPVFWVNNKIRTDGNRKKQVCVVVGIPGINPDNYTVTGSLILSHNDPQKANVSAPPLQQIDFVPPQYAAILNTPGVQLNLLKILIYLWPPDSREWRNSAADARQNVTWERISTMVGAPNENFREKTQGIFDSFTSPLMACHMAIEGRFRPSYMLGKPAPPDYHCKVVVVEQHASRPQPTFHFSGVQQWGFWNGGTREETDKVGKFVGSRKRRRLDVDDNPPATPAQPMIQHQPMIYQQQLFQLQAAVQANQQVGQMQFSFPQNMVHTPQAGFMYNNGGVPMYMNTQATTPSPIPSSPGSPATPSSEPPSPHAQQSPFPNIPTNFPRNIPPTIPPPNYLQSQPQNGFKMNQPITSPKAAPYSPSPSPVPSPFSQPTSPPSSQPPTPSPPCAPSIEEVVPDQGPAYCKNVVTVWGTGFVGPEWLGQFGVRIFFGAEEGVIERINGGFSCIKCRTPSAQPGKVTVSVHTGTTQIPNASSLLAPSSATSLMDNIHSAFLENAYEFFETNPRPQLSTTTVKTEPQPYTDIMDMHDDLIGNSFSSNSSSSSSSSFHNQSSEWNDLNLCFRLMLAAYRGDTNLLRSFLQNDQVLSLIDARDDTGGTPLFWAVWSGHIDVAQLLLVNAEETPLHVACDSQKPSLVSLLLLYGADPNVPNSDGETPIFYGSNSEEIVAMLLEHGARNVRNFEGKGYKTWDGPDNGEEDDEDDYEDQDTEDEQSEVSDSTAANPLTDKKPSTPSNSDAVVPTSSRRDSQVRQENPSSFLSTGSVREVMDSLSDAVSELVLLVVILSEQNAPMPKQLPIGAAIVGKTATILSGISRQHAANYAEFPELSAEINRAAEAVETAAIVLERAIAILASNSDRRKGWNSLVHACRIMAGKTIRLLQLVFGASHKSLVITADDIFTEISIVGKFISSNKMVHLKADELTQRTHKIISCSVKLIHNVQLRVQEEKSPLGRDLLSTVVFDLRNFTQEFKSHAANYLAELKERKSLISQTTTKSFSDAMNNLRNQVIRAKLTVNDTSSPIRAQMENEGTSDVPAINQLEIMSRLPSSYGRPQKTLTSQQRTELISAINGFADALWKPIINQRKSASTSPSPSSPPSTTRDPALVADHVFHLQQISRKEAYEGLKDSLRLLKCTVYIKNPVLTHCTLRQTEARAKNLREVMKETEVMGGGGMMMQYAMRMAEDVERMTKECFPRGEPKDPIQTLEVIEMLYKKADRGSAWMGGSFSLLVRSPEFGIVENGDKYSSDSPLSEKMYRRPLKPEHSMTVEWSAVKSSLEQKVVVVHDPSISLDRIKQCALSRTLYNPSQKNNLENTVTVISSLLTQFKSEAMAASKSQNFTGSTSDSLNSLFTQIESKWKMIDQFTCASLVTPVQEVEEAFDLMVHFVEKSVGDDLTQNFATAAKNLTNKVNSLGKHVVQNLTNNGSSFYSSSPFSSSVSSSSLITENGIRAMENLRESLKEILQSAKQILGQSFPTAGTHFSPYHHRDLLLAELESISNSKMRVFLSQVARALDPESQDRVVSVQISHVFAETDILRKKLKGYSTNNTKVDSQSHILDQVTRVASTLENFNTITTDLVTKPIGPKNSFLGKNKDNIVKKVESIGKQLVKEYMIIVASTNIDHESNNQRKSPNLLKSSRSSSLSSFLSSSSSSSIFFVESLVNLTDRTSDYLNSLQNQLVLNVNVINIFVKEKTSEKNSEEKNTIDFKNHDEFIATSARVNNIMAIVDTMMKHNEKSKDDDAIEFYNEITGNSDDEKGNGGNLQNNEQDDVVLDDLLDTALELSLLIRSLVVPSSPSPSSSEEISPEILPEHAILPVLTDDTDLVQQGLKAAENFSDLLKGILAENPSTQNPSQKSSDELPTSVQPPASQPPSAIISPIISVGSDHMFEDVQLRDAQSFEDVTAAVATAIHFHAKTTSIEGDIIAQELANLARAARNGEKQSMIRAARAVSEQITVFCEKLSALSSAITGNSYHDVVQQDRLIRCAHALKNFGTQLKILTAVKASSITTSRDTDASLASLTRNLGEVVTQALKTMVLVNDSSDMI